MKEPGVHEGKWVYLDGIGHDSWLSRNGRYYGDIISETQGQYTGLHDKRDKEIYEGDVVRISEDRNGSSINLGFVSVVQYRGGAFVFRGVGGGWGPLVRVSGMKYAHVTEDSDGEILPLAEVVGNIYENPELLAGD